MRKKAFIKTQLNLYMKYRINRPAEEEQSRKSATRNRIFLLLCSALLCSALILWHYLLSSVIYLFNEISYSRVSHLFTVQSFSRHSFAPSTVLAYF